MRLALEALGTAAVFAVGAYVALNFQDLRSIATRSAGITASAPDSAAKSAPRDSIASVGNTASGRSVELTAKRGGHFFVEAEINGRPVGVMVDTGATMVALTYDDARRAGLSPRDSDFTQRVNTANGVTRVAPVMIERIQIGGIMVRNVEAAILEEGKL
ncbi:MAG: TIGR02281 family clan AA aspartic protease, partial [Hyphomicrobiaceae bacterium]|nr:TIGR02281 family clan AA aspartic protease [Hyphomicrobiaceae bacterium]